jgi:hypothetical protein
MTEKRAPSPSPAIGLVRCPLSAVQTPFTTALLILMLIVMLMMITTV